MQSSEMRTQIIFQILFIISSLFHVVNFSAPIISGRVRDKKGAGGGKGGSLGAGDAAQKFHFSLISCTGCGGRWSWAGAELAQAAVAGAGEHPGSRWEQPGALSCLAHFATSAFLCFSKADTKSSLLPHNFRLSGSTV